jgi:hypothetical protein
VVVVVVQVWAVERVQEEQVVQEVEAEGVETHLVWSMVRRIQAEEEAEDYREVETPVVRVEQVY